MNTLIFLSTSITVFGASISFSWIITALLALWEFIGRVFPTWHDSPPTPVGWVISLLNWINTTFNNKK